MAKEQFYLVLPSNPSMKTFPNNTLTEYTTQLPRLIQLDGEWEAVLVEIRYPRTWNNVRNRENGIYVISSKGNIPQAKHIYLWGIIRI